jgi:hypothetical protein
MLPLLFLLACKGGDSDDLTEPVPTTDSTVSTDTSGLTGDTASLPPAPCSPTTNALRFDCDVDGTLRWWPADDPAQVREAVADGSYRIWGLRANVDTIVELPDGTLTFVRPGPLPPQLLASTALASGTASTPIAIPTPCEGRDLVVLDEQGRLVWYESFQAAVSAIDITPDGTFLVLIGGTRLIEVDVFGNALLNVADFEHPLHHDVSRDEAGNTYALFAHAIEHEGVEYVLDGLYVVDRAGSTVAEWFLADHLPDGTLFPDDRGQYWQGRFPDAVDFSHANSVEVSPDEGLVLSFRWLHGVLKLTGDPTSGDFGALEWVVSAPQGDLPSDFELSGTDPAFDGQHHATLDDQGRLWLFDNGADDEPSRGLRFELDGDTAEVSAAWSLERHCPIQGGAYPTADDGVLLTCSGPGEVREFGPGQSVPRFELDLSCDEGRSHLVNRAVPVEKWGP